MVYSESTFCHKGMPVLTEKLLLHLLMILAPILGYGFYQDHLRASRSPYLYGVLLGISSLVCMAFPFYYLGFYWDLRNIPMVIAFLYAGQGPGFITMGAILLMRTVIGGDQLLFGYVNCLLSGGFLYLMSRSFLGLSSRKRVNIVVLISLWPMLVSLLMLVIHLSIQPVKESLALLPLSNIVMFGFIYIAAAWIGAKLNETMLEHRQMKEKIRRAEKLNTLSDLAASIVHEVRNPLTVVKGFMQLSQRRAEDAPNYVPLILEELNRAESILNDFLSFARPELKKLESLDLSRMLDHTAVLLTPLGLKAGVMVTADIEEGIVLTTDKSLLQQAIVNLMKNAVEATASGGQVSLQLKREGGEARIHIADTGAGMNEAQLKRLGTPYYSTKDRGTGLGTSIALRTIETLGGSLSYESKVHVGTRVTIRFPLAAKTPNPPLPE